MAKLTGAGLKLSLVEAAIDALGTSDEQGVRDHVAIEQQRRAEVERKRQEAEARRKAEAEARAARARAEAAASAVPPRGARANAGQLGRDGTVAGQSGRAVRE